MKKVLLGITTASILGLSACDSESINDVQNNVNNNSTAVTASARLVFDPSNGVLSVPNDLLFQGTTDGTLNIPVDDPSIESDPSVALSALDGWSTVNPFLLAVNFPNGTSLDADTLSGSVHFFEAKMGGDVNDPDCTAIASGLACKVVNKLTEGVDFIAKKSANNIAIVPITPLKAETTYILALSNSLKDSKGKSLKGSPTYELVRQDIKTKPLSSAAQLALQGVINSFENVVVNEGLEADSIIYTMAMTTQSTSKVLNTLKGLMVANLAQGGLPPSIVINPAELTVNEVFLSQGRMLSEPLQALYSTANYHSGKITLPYYLGIPSIENPKAPVNTWWKARCDSGVTLASLAAQNPAAIPANALNANDGFCMALGLRDLSSNLAVDTERHLTKFNPVPMPQAQSNISYISHPGDIDVQMTTPKLSPVTNTVRANYGLPELQLPKNGWPVVILQHGITSKKEDMLAMTGILSTFGFATVAIDHPLHGSRGFDLDPTIEGDEINASTVSATHYMNLKSLLTTRDNLRQSTSDTLGLRLGLNALVGAEVDAAQVYYLGHSLGAITGINFVSVANTAINPAIDPMFEIKANSLAMPGGMVANFLIESKAFGDVIKSNLTFAQSKDFQLFVTSQYTNPSESELANAYKLFYANLNEQQQASINNIFSQFVFAAQTVIDSGDPINYSQKLLVTNTPTHLIEVVGDGAQNLSDQVIPNTIARSPLGGTEGIIALLELNSVSISSSGSGVVRFLNGHHSSILSPMIRAESPSVSLSAAATQEMQSQVVSFFATQGQNISVSNDIVVQ